MAISEINTTDIRKYLLEELSSVLEESPKIQKTIAGIFQHRFSDKGQTDDRFDKQIEALRQEREASEFRWREQQRVLEEHIEAEQKRWDENNARWDENNKRWEEHDLRWDEMQRKSDERFEFLVGEIKAIHRKHEGSIGALGARWGIAAESSFRSALKDILEQQFGVQVLNITEYDDEGEVFGHPDQVELDIIIKNGDLIICEIKSSISRSEMYTFYKKAQFYEKHHQRKATRLIVISPMVEQRALAVAQKFGITVHSYVDDVRLPS